MKAPAPKPPNRSAWPLLSFVILGAAAVAGMFWLKRQNPAAASMLAPVLAIAVMGGAILVARRQQRRMDEVQLAGQRFATYQAFTYGAMATMLLLMLPPVTNWLVDVVARQAGASLDETSRRAARLSFIYGACLLVLIQMLTMMGAAAFWGRRMGLSSERAE